MGTVSQLASRPSTVRQAHGSRRMAKLMNLKKGISVHGEPVETTTENAAQPAFREVCRKGKMRDELIIE